MWISEEPHKNRNVSRREINSSRIGGLNDERIWLSAGRKVSKRMTNKNLANVAAIEILVEAYSF